MPWRAGLRECPGKSAPGLPQCLGEPGCESARESKVSLNGPAAIDRRGSAGNHSQAGRFALEPTDVKEVLEDSVKRCEPSSAEAFWLKASCQNREKKENRLTW